MPLTLEKLFSATVKSSLEVLGETIHLEWSPVRYTGEMDELAERLASENAEDKATLDELLAAEDEEGADEVRQRVKRREASLLRTFTAALLVSWDLMDGKKPYPIDEASLKRLPDFFVEAVFLAMSEENATDPQNAPSSDGSSSTKVSSERSPRGSSSSEARKSSASRRGT